MMRPAFVPWIVFKEVRALAVPWCLVALAIFLPLLAVTWGGLKGLSLVAYYLGTVVLGAWSMGHEFADGTVGVLLCHPVDRARLFSAKLGVLAVGQIALVALAAMAALAVMTLLYAMGSLPAKGSAEMAWPVTLYRMGIPHVEGSVVWAVISLPLLCGIGIAPWFTVACRNSGAGAVFAMIVPGVLLVLGERLAVLGFGEFRLAIVWYGTLAIAVLGVPLSWRAFARLEDSERRGGDIQLPSMRWRTAVPGAAVKRHSMFRMLLSLAGKELRLQHLTLALAGMYGVGWVAATMFRDPIPPAVPYMFAPTALFYAGVVALLAGAVSCAEERRLGVLGLQLLLPVSTRVQWAVKSASVLATSLLLGWGLPWVLASILPSLEPKSLSIPRLVQVICILSAIGIYMSSLSSIGLGAFVRAIGGAVALALLIPGVRYWVGESGHLGQAWHQGVVRAAPQWMKSGDFWRSLSDITLWTFTLGFLGVALAFGLANHRYAALSTRRVVLQMLAIVVFVACWLIVMLEVETAWSLVRL